MSVQILAEYIEYLDVEKGLSQNTTDAYRRDLSEFWNFCNSKGVEELEEVSRGDISSYILNLHDEKYSPTSIMRKIASLRGLYKWMSANEYCKSDPTITIEQPKLPKRLPKVVSVKEIEEMLNFNLTPIQKVIIDDYKSVSQEYMYYHFLNERQSLVSSSNGSVFNNLKTDIVKAHQIIIPDKNTMQAATNIFCVLNKSIKQNAQEINALIKLKNNILSQMSYN